MNVEAAQELARAGKLYPAVILHGADAAARSDAALRLARLLLCDAAPEARPCGVCRHCRRIVWPDDKNAESRSGGPKSESPKSEGRFHPDFHVLLRDLRTSTSVEATRNLLRPAQVSPFEARGQVFVVASAETLTPEAANSLLKNLEEPPDSAPRHFFLLAPSRLDLLPTLRSRSLSLYLGPAEALDAELVERLAGALAGPLGAFAGSGAGVYLLLAADTLKGGISGWDDPRASQPWRLAAAALVRAVELGLVPGELRRRVLNLAEALLEATDLRLRGITADRVLEGFFSRTLAGGELGTAQA